MNVTGVSNPFPTTLAPNTIYVVSDPIISITAPIVMAPCSAVVSSQTNGTLFEGPTQLSGIFFTDNAQYIILDNISISGTGMTPHTPNTYWIYADNNFSNSTMNNVQIWGTTYGFYLGGNSMNDVIDHSKAYNNAYGMYLGNNSTNNTIDNSQAYNNSVDGIYIENSSTNEIVRCETYDNTRNGIYLGIASDTTTISNTFSYRNNNVWILIQSSNNTLDTIDTHDNAVGWILLSGANNNTLTTIIANGSTVGMWIRLFSSVGNTLNWVTAYGNYYAGVHLHGSNYNTGINITSNSNDGWLYLKNSTNNNFTNLIINNSDGNWAVFTSWTNYNTLSGSTFSGNRWYGTYRQSSNNNTIINSSLYGNLLWGSSINTWNNNTLQNLQIYNNTGFWIFMWYISWSVISNVQVYNNPWINSIDWAWIYLLYSTWTTLQNSSISGNANVWIKIDYWFWNIISWSTFSGNAPMLLNRSFNNHMHNAYSFSTVGPSCVLEWWTGNVFSLFSWNNPIRIAIYSWNHWTNINSAIDYSFDTYTKANNYIELYAEPYVTLTGAAISAWSQFSLDFDMTRMFEIVTGLLEDRFIMSWTSSFTISGASRDGRLYSPVKITTGTKLWATGEAWMSTLVSILDTIEVISWSTYLVMSWWTGTIDFHVLSWSSGQYIKILKSVDGNTRALNSVDSGCTLDQALLCSFRTNGDIKLFAFWSWTYTNCSYAGYTTAWNTVTSGGHYNTWVRIYFTGDNASWATLNGSWYASGTLITGDNNYVFVLADSWGNTIWMNFVVDTINPVVTGNYPTSWLNITSGNTITFTRSWSDTNISWYTLYVDSTWYSLTGTSLAVALPNGSYTRYVIAIDHAGNTGTSISLPFVISATLVGTATITGITYTGYTNSVFPIILSTNKAADFSMTWDITWAMLPPYTGVVSSSTTYNLTLTTGDGTKTVYITFSTGSETYTATKSIILDTTAPSLPSLTTPASGATATGDFTLVWSASSDAGVGLSGYQYFVSTTWTIGTWIVKSWYVASTVTWVSIANFELWITGTFYRYVKAIDRLNNSWTSVAQPFVYSGIYDIIPNTFSFSSVTSARIDRVYGSNTVTITWFTPNTSVLASINRWVLYISGNMVGTTGYVQNGRTVKIELVSSSDYDEEVTSTLTIGWISATFRVTTETEAEANDDVDYSDISTNLSSTEKLQIIAVFEALRDLYAGSKQDEFFDSLMVMLQSKIDDLGTSAADTDRSEALQYLYDLADQYRDSGSDNTDISNTSRIVNGIYTAPNGKKYTITYDSVKKQFTSRNFITPKYYPTLDVLKYDIDRNNPVWSQYANAKTIKARWGKISIDGTRQTSPYTAPNHKVFYFFKTTAGQYSSYTFTTEKYFDDLEAVKEHIYNNNR